MTNGGPVKMFTSRPLATRSALNPALTELIKILAEIAVAEYLVDTEAANNPSGRLDVK
jgi:hypothetical protein